MSSTLIVTSQKKNSKSNLDIYPSSMKHFVFNKKYYEVKILTRRKNVNGLLVEKRSNAIKGNRHIASNMYNYYIACCRGLFGATSLLRLLHRV
jgi:hypothetical protein